MNFREKVKTAISNYWWIIIVIIFVTIGIGFFFTNIPIFNLIIYIIAIIIALGIFLPFIISLFSPAAALISSLVEHFKEAQDMSFGKKYIFIPFALIAICAFSLAMLIISLWVLILSFSIWSSTIGFFFTFILSFFLGLAPLTILSAPILAWIKYGFASFLTVVIYYLLAVCWYSFSKLAFSEDYSSTPEYFLGYSPQHFLLGALSLQIISLPLYYFNFFSIGYIVSLLGGWLFLIFSIISAFKWHSLKKKLSIEEQEGLYRPPVWIYIVGFLFTNILGTAFDKIEAPTAIIKWLNLFFFIVLIGRFIRIFRRKPKVRNPEY